MQSNNQGPEAEEQENPQEPNHQVSVNWQFHSWATGPTAHGSCTKGRLCLLGRHQCPQHGTYAASGEASALASSLQNTKSEPAASLGISSVKRLAHKGLGQERR